MLSHHTKDLKIKNLLNENAIEFEIKEQIKQLATQSLFSVCPQMPPVLSLRGAFCATKQSPLFNDGIASLKIRLWQKTPRKDRSWYLRTDSNYYKNQSISGL